MSTTTADASPDLDLSQLDEPKVKPERVVATPDEDRRWQNWNPLFNAMADAQGVEVGSWDWVLGGIAPWSGSSGEQASYGWDHSHKLTPDYIRAVLANYGHRRAYYGNALFRQWDYAAAARPHGWEPESPGDLADGSTAYLSSNGPVIVSGPDAEHLWLTPLYALIDDPNPILCDTGLGNKLPSNVLARIMATQLTSAAVGMVRDKNGDGTQPYPWAYPDRPMGRLLHTITESMKRGCLAPGDVPTAAYFIRDIVLPFYEKAPGMYPFGVAPEGQFPMGLFNGLRWILPVCHDAARELEKRPKTKPWAKRFDALVARWSQWTVDLEAVAPGQSAKADIVYLKNEAEFVQGENDAAPVASIARFLDESSFHFSHDYSTWAYRSIDIAFSVTGHEGLEKVRDEIAAEHAASKREWVVPG